MCAIIQAECIKGEKYMENKKKPNNENINSFTIPRRIAWFVLRTVLIITIIVTLAFFFFLTGMHSANTYILVTEGMTLRASCILGKSDTSELKQYFTDKFIETDPALQENEYSYYTIQKYDYRISVDGISILPWNTTATLTVTERIPTITGEAKKNAPTDAVPEWQNAQYKVVCIKKNNRWFITKITKVKDAEKSQPNATPDMNLLNTKKLNS